MQRATAGLRLSLLNAALAHRSAPLPLPPLPPGLSPPPTKTNRRPPPRRRPSCASAAPRVTAAAAAAAVRRRRRSTTRRRSRRTSISSLTEQARAPAAVTGSCRPPGAALPLHFGLRSAFSLTSSAASPLPEVGRPRNLPQIKSGGQLCVFGLCSPPPTRLPVGPNWTPSKLSLHI